MESGCFTCQVNVGDRPIPGGRIYSDEYWVADHGIPPLVRGHVVLKPSRHVRDLADMTPEEATSLGPAVRRLEQAMRVALSPERIYVSAFGESVRHLHFHLLPRYADMPVIAPIVLEAAFDSATRCTEQDAEAAAREVRDALRAFGS